MKDKKIDKAVAVARTMANKASSKLPEVLYHGTRAATKIAKSGRFEPSLGGEYGPGVYLGTDPGTADFFASNVARGDEGPSIIPVKHSLKNPFYTTKQDWLKMQERSSPRTIQKRLKGLGHDSIVSQGLGGGGTQVVAFNHEHLQPALSGSWPQTDE